MSKRYIFKKIPLKAHIISQIQPKYHNKSQKSKRKKEKQLQRK